GRERDPVPPGGVRHRRPGRRLLLTDDCDGLLAPAMSHPEGARGRVARRLEGTGGARVDLDEVADELYEVPPEEFIALRTARENEARAGGDKVLAKSIGAL